MGEPTTEIEELKKLLQQERQRADAAEYYTRKTTLQEFLNACHDLSKLIKIEENPHLTTQGNLTEQYERKYPKRIIPWDKSVLVLLRPCSAPDVDGVKGHSTTTTLPIRAVKLSL
jgi:hypothetical protein